MFNNRFFPCFLAILVLTGCDANNQMGPGASLDTALSATTIALPPPTLAQQVQQPDKPWCAPSAGLTNDRVITKKDEPLEQVVAEMHTTESGTPLSDFMNWHHDHQMIASSTSIWTTGAVGMIASQITSGSYVVPYVNENAKANAPHVFIIYAIDLVKGKVYVSDSNKHLGQNRIAINVVDFRDKWLINTGTKDFPTAILMFINSRPAPTSTPLDKQPAASFTELPYGNLLIK